MDPTSTAPPTSAGWPHAELPAVTLGGRLGQYRLERALATGGMAELYLARKSGPGPERPVVVKRILPHLTTNPEFIHMFLDEARIAARLSHPNIVQVFDFGEAGGNYFLVMEYLSGEDLDTILAVLREAGRTMPPVVAAMIASAACEGLHYAHTLVDERGTPLKIVHRDVSPSNIFLTGHGQVKILDFGIAKAEGKFVHTQGGVLKGKLLYMSPEQVHGLELDGRSDVFSLGAVLFELLTGHPAFARSNTLSTLKAIADEPLPRPSELAEGVPLDLEGVVTRALERNSRLRWQSALDMRQALDRFIDKNSLGPANTVLADFLHDLAEQQGPLGGTRVRSSVLPARLTETLPPVTSSPPRRAMSEAATMPPEVRSPADADGPTSLADSSSLATLEPESTVPVRLEERLLPEVSVRRRWPALAAAGTLLLALFAGLGWSLSAPSPSQDVGDVAPPPSASATPAATPEVLPVTPKAPADEPAPPSTPPLLHPPTAGPAPRRPKATETGTLDINCVPWCHIYVDGKDTRLDSPAKGLVLSAGAHQLRLVHPPSGVAQELPIHLGAGQVVRHVIRF